MLVSYSPSSQLNLFIVKISIKLIVHLTDSAMARKDRPLEFATGVFTAMFVQKDWARSPSHQSLQKGYQEAERLCSRSRPTLLVLTGRPVAAFQKQES